MIFCVQFSQDIGHKQGWDWDHCGFEKSASLCVTLNLVNCSHERLSSYFDNGIMLLVCEIWEDRSWPLDCTPCKIINDAVIMSTKISGHIRLKCHGLFSMGQSVPGWNGVYINVQLPIRSNLQLEDFR